MKAAVSDSSFGMFSFLQNSDQELGTPVKLTAQFTAAAS